MDSFDQPIRKIISSLNERGKELSCLYKVIDILKGQWNNLDEMVEKLFEVLPPGWQYPGIVEVKIIIGEMVFCTPDFKDSEWMQESAIISDSKTIGSIYICYTQLIRMVNGSQFLDEEKKLLDTIADRIGDYILLNSLRNAQNEISKSIVDYLFNIDLTANNKNFHWKWRSRFAQIIADKIDFERFGVKAVYLMGSVKNASSGPGSDIDLLIHCSEDESLNKELSLWIEGWGYSLAEFNRKATGYRSELSMIDLHIITDEDIKNKDSYAIKINAHTDKAKLLR